MALSACSSRLEVLPTQEIDESAALSTPAGVTTTLLGAYSGMQSANTFAGAYQYTADLVGDDREVQFGGTFSTLDEFWRKEITPTNTQVTNTWASSYETINRANNVLSALNVLDEASRDRVEGEALFIRAATHFELVRLFAKAYSDGDPSANPGVPLVVTPTRSITPESFVSRATVAAVYAKVIEDLVRAEQVLPATGSPLRATRFAAAALLSRVYLMQGNYATARDAANRVIASENYELAEEFAVAFNDETNGGPSPENIFSVLVTNQDGTNALNTFYAPADFGGRGDIRVQTRHLQLYDAADQRRGFFTTAGNRTFTQKFLDQFGNVPIIRLAEMYLTRAEANFRLNGSVGATPLADINLIRERAGLAPLTSLTLDAILGERRLELAFEGHLLHDLKRTRRPVGTTAFGADNLVLPIPQREIDTNTNLRQNPGYQ